MDGIVWMEAIAVWKTAVVGRSPDSADANRRAGDRVLECVLYFQSLVPLRDRVGSIRVLSWCSDDVR